MFCTVMELWLEFMTQTIIYRLWATKTLALSDIQLGFISIEDFLLNLLLLGCFCCFKNLKICVTDGYDLRCMETALVKSLSIF